MLPYVTFLDTFRTRNISIVHVGQMENGDHNVSFTCYFAPCVAIKGKCFINFTDGSRNITIEADNPADTTATYHYIGKWDALEYRIDVHDVFINGTVQKEVVLHTSFSILLSSAALHTKGTGTVQDHTIV